MKIALTPDSFDHPDTLKEHSTYILRYLLDWYPSNIYLTLLYLKDPGTNIVKINTEKLFKELNTVQHVYEGAWNVLRSYSLVTKLDKDTFEVHGHIVDDWVYLTNSMWYHLESLSENSIDEAIEEMTELGEEAAEAGAVISRLPSKKDTKLYCTMERLPMEVMRKAAKGDEAYLANLVARDVEGQITQFEYDELMKRYGDDESSDS